MPLPASQPWGFFFSRKSKGTKTLKVKKLKKTFKSWQKEIPVFLMKLGLGMGLQLAKPCLH